MAAAVSVVIPAHNKAETLASTIESVRRQTVSDVEIIVVDDGSTDGTEERISKLGDGIRYFRQKASGVSSARNRGIREAQAPYVAFLDGDDLWLPRKLEIQLDFLKRNPSLDAVQCGVYLVDNGLRVIGTRRCVPEEDTLMDFLFFRNLPGVGSTLLARTEKLKEMGGFGEDLVILEDWDLVCRFARHGGIRSLPECLVLYRQHPGNRSQNVNIHIEPGFRSLGRLFADPTLSEDVRQHRRQVWARLYAMFARAYGRNRQWGPAAGWSLRALWTSPIAAAYLTSPSASRRIASKQEQEISFASELPFGVLAS